MVATIAALALIVATFTPWRTAAIIINLAILYAACDPLVGQLNRK